ncbi:OLC1v1038141C2 [Oldenlandia corymbosa var. corymbosa]|nr:OLC1v1038141C2 [Oldenlandia corymbosa var. corymbosa]
MDDDNAPPSPPSLKSKIKNSLCFSCCFRRRHHSDHRQVPCSPSDEKPNLIWVKTNAPHDLKDEIKDKCLAILGRIGNNGSGGGGGGRHKRHSSTEFRYDPLSYALNFEDGFDYDDDEYPLRNFSARLPPPPSSLPVDQPAVPLRGITAV